MLSSGARVKNDAFQWCHVSDNKQPPGSIPSVRFRPLSTASTNEYRHRTQSVPNDSTAQLPEYTLRPPLCGWIPLRCAIFVLWMRIFFLYRDRSKVYFKEEFSGPSKSQTTIQQLDSLVKRGCSNGTKRKCKSGSRLQLDGGGLIDFGICISSRHCHFQSMRVRGKSRID